MQRAIGTVIGWQRHGRIGTHETLRNRYIYGIVLFAALLLVGVMLMVAEFTARRDREALGKAQQESERLSTELAREKAERALRHATKIAVVGFSFTPTDLHVEAVARLALARGTALKALVIANPSPDDRRRIRSVFSKQLERGAVVRQYEDFQEFVSALPSSLG